MPRSKHNKLTTFTKEYFLTSALTTRWMWRMERGAKLVGVYAKYSTAHSSTETIQLKKSATSAVALADATALTSTYIPDDALDTEHSLTLSTTAGATDMKEGEWIGVVVSSTLTSLAGGSLVAVFEAAV